MDPIALAATMQTSRRITIANKTLDLKKRQTVLNPPIPSSIRRMSGDVSRMATQDNLAEIEEQNRIEQARR